MRRGLRRAPGANQKQPRKAEACGQAEAERIGQASVGVARHREAYVHIVRPAEEARTSARAVRYYFFTVPSLVRRGETIIIDHE